MAPAGASEWSDTSLYIIRVPLSVCLSVCLSVYLSRHAFKNLQKEFVPCKCHGVSIISQHGGLHIFRSKNWSVQNSKTSVRLCFFPSVSVSVCLSRHGLENFQKEFVPEKGHGISIISQRGWYDIFGSINLDKYYIYHPCS